MANFLGLPYPIQKTVQGFLPLTTDDTTQIKSDLLILLLTNPGERVMLPDFGTPLNRLIFEPGDDIVVRQARDIIATSIDKWEPRVQIEDILVTVTGSEVNTFLSPDDPRTEEGTILGIRILFIDPNNLKDVQELVLEIPLGGT